MTAGTVNAGFASLGGLLLAAMAMAASAGAASGPDRLEELKAAIAAADEGGTVKLSGDILLPGAGSLRIDKSITLDLGGREIANCESANLVLFSGRRLVVLNGSLRTAGQSCLVPLAPNSEIYATNCTLRGDCGAYSAAAGTKVVFGAGTRVETESFMSGHPTCRLICVADGCVDRSRRPKDGPAGTLNIVECVLPPAEDPERPQLHFTPPKWWMNDPNGMSYHNGEWHLFYQYKKEIHGCAEANWGHAVSKDLIAWRHLPEAVREHDGGGAWSGSGFTDFGGVAGFGKGEHLIFYTWRNSFRHDVHIAHSRDGRVYAPYGGNPVVKADRLEKDGGNDRDPWVFWHAGAKKWVMLVYADKLEGKEKAWRPYYIVYNSDDLREWKEVNRLYPWMAECPMMAEFPIEGEKNAAWVFWGAGSHYQIGSFDGRDFKVEAEAEGWFGGDKEWYAGQIFNDAPDGRKVFAAWAKFDLPPGSKRTFNQGLSLVQELTLVRTKDGLRLKRLPVREYEALRVGEACPGGAFEGELAEVRLDAVVEPGGRLEMSLRGVTLVYDDAQATLSCGGASNPWPLVGRRLALAIWVDRMGIDVFDGSGLRCMPLCHVRPDPTSRAVAVTGRRGVRDVACRVWKLNSIYR